MTGDGYEVTAALSFLQVLPHVAVARQGLYCTSPRQSNVEWGDERNRELQVYAHELNIYVHGPTSVFLSMPMCVLLHVFKSITSTSTM